MVALYASSQWETWLTWRFAVPFGQADPILGRDVGFYVFSLPFLQFVRRLAQTLVLLAGLGAGASLLCVRQPQLAFRVVGVDDVACPAASVAAGGGVFPAAGSGRLARARPSG